ncbi:acid protease [Mycena pura]|uniref:Acid protease n=1 Tax=Mycena pura TaxID=153505 RepID=A0AAD6YRA5_9AGAR|nr:acid protease [Mycena pura]
MGFLSLVALLPLLGATSATFSVVQHRALIPNVQQEARALPEAQFTTALGKTARRKSKRHALALLRGKTHPGGINVPLTGADFEEEYITNVTVGDQHFSLIVDTGSSDTWIVQKGFTCLDLSGNPVPQPTCAFGSEGFDLEASRTFKAFPNVSLSILYGGGEFVKGDVGFDNIVVGVEIPHRLCPLFRVTFFFWGLFPHGGLSVHNQEMGFPQITAFEGDGLSSGIMGLAFPGLTSVFNTSNPDNASAANFIPYLPLFFSAIQQKAVEKPLFSIALDRASLEQQQNNSFVENLGRLSFGGIAPVPVTETSTTVPVQGYSTVSGGTPSNARNSTDLWYTVDVAAYKFPGSNSVNTKSNNTILDSGTTLNLLPNDVVAAYASACNPPAVFNATTELYMVDCKATVPEFYVTIGDKTFSIDPRDQILADGTDANGNPLCVFGTQEGGDGGNASSIFILGEVFLHNVVATFNPIEKEITLTQRAKY